MNQTVLKKKYKYWSYKEISLLRKLYPQAKRIRDLVKFFPNRKKETIAWKASNLKLSSARTWQSEENSILHNLFADSPRKILLKSLPKRSWVAILAHGEKLGLKRRRDVPKLKVNEHYFKKWSFNMAYILGFIVADGCIIHGYKGKESDRLTFGLNRRDIDILQKIKQELSAEQSLSISGNYIYLYIQRQVIVEDLKKLGISYRKSFMKISPMKFSEIPSQYIKDFIRGVIDGDGSISFDKKGYPSINVCGGKQLITFIRNHFLIIHGTYSKIGQAKKDNKYYNLFYISYRSNSAKKLIDYLYTNASLYLDRKMNLAKRAWDVKISHRKNYTEEEKQFIQNSYAISSREKILSILPSRSWTGIQQKASRIGVYRYNIK